MLRFHGIAPREVAMTNPFILKLLQAHGAGNVSTPDAIVWLRLIEAFLVGRAVCAFQNAV
jgi:hypothetical protein